MRGPATRLMESCSSKLGACLGWAKAAIERTTSARDAETRVRIGKPPKTVRRAADYSVSLADRRGRDVFARTGQFAASGRIGELSLIDVRLLSPIVDVEVISAG